jgi:hypothetical protein
MYGWGDQDIGWHSLFTPAAFWILVCIAVCTVVLFVYGRKMAKWIDHFDTIAYETEKAHGKEKRRRARQNR